MKIPDAALQQHIAVLGKTGSGKTFAIKGIVERWLEEKRRVGIVDPTGAWWGLRSSRDGKGAGFPILVLGGDHGDLLLPAASGAAVARLLAEQNVNLVADTSLLTVGERTRWFIDFAGTLYRLNRAPLHLILDEAHNFAPQGSGSVRDVDVGKMLHAANTLASGGRSRGIRLTMITQRPQKLHKDTLTSADTLIAMRVLAPHDRGAVEDWIKGCGDIAQGKEVLNSLASLARGEGWIWHPEGSFLQRLKFPAIKTFDSSATPTDGGTVPTPKAAAEIDLTEIRAAMADAVKEAEANDPKLLRAEIARMRAEAAKKKPAAERIEVKVVDHEAVEVAEKRGYDRGHADALTKAAEAVRALVPAFTPSPRAPISRAPAAVGRPAPRPSAPAPAEASGLAAAQRKILNALAFLESVGITTPDKTQVSLFAALSPTAGHTQNMYGGLRTAELINYPSPGVVMLTDAGRKFADPGRVPQTAEEMQQVLLGRVAAAQRKILSVLIEAYPDDIDKREASERAGLSATAGHTQNMYGGLRSLGLIDYPTPGRVVALPVLFLE